MTTPNRPPKVGDVWGDGQEIWWLITGVESENTLKIKHLTSNVGYETRWRWVETYVKYELKFNIFDDINWPKLMEELKHEST